MRRSHSPARERLAAAPRAGGARAADAPHGERSPAKPPTPDISTAASGHPSSFSPGPLQTADVWKLNLHISVGGDDPISSSDSLSADSLWFGRPCEPVVLVPGLWPVRAVAARAALPVRASVCNRHVCTLLLWMRARAGWGGPGRNPVCVWAWPDRLLFHSAVTVPASTASTHYFSIDDELLYVPFFADFGPLNLGKVRAAPTCWLACCSPPAPAPACPAPTHPPIPVSFPSSCCCLTVRAERPRRRQVYRYCERVNGLLSSPEHAGQVVCHVSALHPHKRVNAVFLAAAYAVLCLGKTPEEAVAPFSRA